MINKATRGKHFSNFSFMNLRVQKKCKDVDVEQTEVKTMIFNRLCRCCKQKSALRVKSNLKLTFKKHKKILVDHIFLNVLVK